MIIQAAGSDIARILPRYRFDMLVKAEPMAAEAVRIVGVIDN